MGAAGGVVTVVVVTKMGDVSRASVFGNGGEGPSGARPRWTVTAKGGAAATE